MRHLLNTLFVTSEDVYLSLDNENVVINRNGTAIKKLPLRMFEQILYFGYMGASPALLGKCAEHGIAVCFYKPSGRFLARVMGIITAMYCYAKNSIGFRIQRSLAVK